MAGETSLTREYEDVLTTTRDMVRPLMSDNITARIPTLLWLNKMGRKELWPGGAQLHFNVFKELTSAQGYTDLDVVTTTRAENMTRAAYEWKQFQSPVTLSGRDMLRNNGEPAIVNLVTARIEAAVLSLAELLGGRVSGVFSNNTESTLTSLTGLQALVSTTPTAGTVGNISRTNGFWQNQNDSVATNFTTDGLISMRSLWLQCSFGSDIPNVVAFNRSTFENYMRALQGTLSYNLPYGASPAPSVANQSTLDLGVNTLSFFGAPVIYDDGVPANIGYFLNSKYIHFVTHVDRDFDLGEFVVTSDTDAIYSHIWFAGELCFSGMRYHGSLSGTLDTFS